MTEYLADQTFQPAPEALCICGASYEDHRASDLACPLVEVLPEGYLTPNFTLAEMIHSDTAIANGIDNTPPPEAIDNLTRLCGVLEEIRVICGSYPVTVNSGYRCEALNEKVGGVEDSAHRYGLGADIVIPDYGDPTDICVAVTPHLVDLSIDQLIDETDGEGNRWVHVGLCEGEPRNECFAL